MTAGTKFPLGGVDVKGLPVTRATLQSDRRDGDTDSAHADLEGFQAWVSHFYDLKDQPLPNGHNHEEAYWEIDWDDRGEDRAWHCYDPQNMQARYLTCSTWGGHFRAGMPNPELNLALREVANADFVGLVEFYRESTCLMYGSMRAGIHAKFDELGCGCTSSSPGADAAELAHITHHAHRRPVHFGEVMRAKLDAVTDADREVYAAALRLFFCRVRYFDSQHSAVLGRSFRLICPATLEARQEELQYIVHNISEVYERASECS